MSDANKKSDDVSTQTDTKEKNLLEELEELEMEEKDIEEIEIPEIEVPDEPQEKGKKESKEEKEIVFMYDDDEKNPNFKKEKEDSEKEEKRFKMWKKVRIALGSVAGILLVIYLGFVLFFNSHFYFQTMINGVEFSAKNLETVEAFMREQVDGYELTIEHNDNTTETIKGSDISLEYRSGEELKRALKEQNPFLWPVSIFKEEVLQIPMGVEYNRDALVTLISELKSVTNKEAKESVSAVPVFDGTEFHIQKEVIGNKVDLEKFTEVVETDLNEFITTLNMEEQECYYMPKYFEDSEEVSAANNKMNEYLKANITYDFTPYTEVVDKTVISGWLTVDENMQVVFQKEKVAEFIKGLAGKYDTAGKPRTFKTANGKTVEVRNGVYGWKINQTEEYNKLISNIEARETVKREPEYARRAISHEGNDFGKTYAEVDLSAQQMWFIKNGEVVLSTPVVTGNPNKGNATPQGTYTLTYKQKGAVLRGKLLPDGTREYESPVDYWMPFNGGIGFHDANWQSSFGGTRYKTHGSHGCINMPHEKAKILFGYIQAGTPVICHY